MGAASRLARYDCVVHWAKLEKPRSEEEAIDTNTRLRRRCVHEKTTIRDVVQAANQNNVAVENIC